jgi:hypothetical protein
MNDEANIIDLVNNNDDRPEPFATVLDPLNEHGYYAVLEAVSDDTASTGQS